MDSILRNYDLPKFYFRKVNDPRYTHEVVDGQQRLRAIWEFCDGVYPLGAISSDLPDGDLAGKHYTELDSTVHDRFGGFGLAVYEIQDASDAEIRDLFLRLQEGASLNPAEKRNAMMGQMRDFIAELSGEGGQPHPVFPLTRISATRNAWDDLAAHVVRLELEGGPADVRADNLKKMYEAQTGFDLHGPVAKKLKRILNIMARVLQAAPPEMDIKWGFVDLYLALSVMDNSYILKGKEFEIASFYVAFETERREILANGDVADLLLPGHDQWDRDMYDYIQAFQREGNKRSNIEIRHHVYLRRLLRDVNPKGKDPKRAFSTDERVVIWRLAGEQCQLCNASIRFEQAQADHVVPYSAGGTTSLDNAQCLCATCNQRKGGNRTSAAV